MQKKKNSKNKTRVRKDQRETTATRTKNAEDVLMVLKGKKKPKHTTNASDQEQTSDSTQHPREPLCASLRPPEVSIFRCVPECGTVFPRFLSGPTEGSV